jgi:RNA-directed DNA polymerase
LSEGRAGGTRPLLAKGVSIKTTMEELAPYMRGWRGYFGFCETPEVLIALTRWVRLRLRAALWRQWKPRVAVVRP